MMVDIKEYTDDEFNEIMDGMQEAMGMVYDKRLADAPICHFRPMDIQQSDSIEGYYTEWWECSVCGHTKDLKERR